MLTPLTQDRWTRRTADHLLFRAGFGGSPEEREALYQLGHSEGVSAAVESLLTPATDWSQFPFPEWTASAEGLGIGGGNARRDIYSWYFNQLAGAAPVDAKMFKFLVDHFPVDWFPIGGSEQKRFYFFLHWDILRKGTTGNFRQLAKDVSWSEAMIEMLDLDVSVKGNVNENFGRELMELFTLGVDGGYTEQDVEAAAAAFTGRKLRNDYPYEAYLNSNREDRSTKSFLGANDNLSGSNQGDQAIDVIFQELQCAYHTCWKLWRYFVHPDPDEALIQTLADRMKNTHDYQIILTLREIFTCEEFYAQENIGIQVKDAADLIVTSLRALEMPMLPLRVLEEALISMGYEPVYPPSIQGWPEPVGAGNEWLASGPMLFRLNLGGIWSHKAKDVLTSGGAGRELADYPEVDFDRIAPSELRLPENFNLLLEGLAHRLLPFHPLRGSQVRGLYDRYMAVRSEAGEVEGIKDLLRLILSLPEYQMQ